MIIIRSMMEDPIQTKQPLINRGKAATLGVRKRDITPDEKGMVHPEMKAGMSAFILPETNIHPDFRPKKFGGKSDDPLWELDDSILLKFELKFELDRPEDNDCVHGLIKTTRSMPHTEYVENLEATQSLWKER
ncbi:hypothetical protein [Vibrio atlanticus]|uniref:hypothetical protein n=1 Tax=Vibrio atlanticus TaxID=693153 RepID=UPI0022AFD668|nr:hypothetical protein [Vibrio atlanticus]MCZ4311639.1 hypothetical protein [Vibrio atlanticus]